MKHQAARQDVVVKSRDLVFVSNLAGTFRIAGPILREWQKSNGPQKWLPLGEAVTSANGLVQVQQFLNSQHNKLASICSHPELGSWWVRGVIRDKWYRLDAERGCLGIPVENEKKCGYGDWRVQTFRQPSSGVNSGAIVSEPEHGTFALYGEIYACWIANGYLEKVGFPETDTLGCGDGVSYVQFGGRVRSRIYWTRDRGAILIRDPFFTAWSNCDAERGPLGYPVNAEECGSKANSRRMRFERGSIFQSASGSIRVQIKRS